MPQSQPRGLLYETKVVISLFVVFTIITTIAGIGRILGRRIEGVKLWVDDYLIAITLLFQYLLLANTLVAVHHGGLGKDVVDAMAVDPDIVLNQCFFAFCLLYGLCSTLAKIAVLAGYWRLFPTKAIKIGTCALGITCIGWFVAIELSTIFQCRPVTKRWYPTLEGWCINNFALVTGKSISNCALDLIILFLPIREIMRLKFTIWEKIATGYLFVLGGFVLVASIFPLIEMTVPYYNDNITQQGLLPWFALTMEINLAVLGICLPTLGPTIRLIYGYSRRVTKGLLSRGVPTGGEAKGSGTLNSIMTMGRTSNRGRGYASSVNERHGAAEGSFVRLDNVDSDIEGLTPKGYNYERHIKIKSARSGDNGIYEEPIPLDGIVVKRDMCWTEGRQV
ncbi:hypothetical protein F5X96DRAFT_401696 [Biscogniauxia mediterranea]|nr:hypothetical protein F5X96DRAFT_401696 [Biscogniauxia mediterranea]